jgi:hypothetical protein
MKIYYYWGRSNNFNSFCICKLRANSKKEVYKYIEENNQEIDGKVHLSNEQRFM